MSDLSEAGRGETEAMDVSMKVTVEISRPGLMTACMQVRYQSLTRGTVDGSKVGDGLAWSPRELTPWSIRPHSRSSELQRPLI